MLAHPERDVGGGRTRRAHQHAHPQHTHAPANRSNRAFHIPHSAFNVQRRYRIDRPERRPPEGKHRGHRPAVPLGHAGGQRRGQRGHRTGEDRERHPGVEARWPWRDGGGGVREGKVAERREVEHGVAGVVEAVPAAEQHPALHDHPGGDGAPQHRQRVPPGSAALPPKRRGDPVVVAKVAVCSALAAAAAAAAVRPPPGILCLCGLSTPIDVDPGRPTSTAVDAAGLPAPAPDGLGVYHHSAGPEKRD